MGKPIKKLSSYQKMKLKYESQIQGLTNDILDLISDDPQRKLNAEIKWKLIMQMEENIWNVDLTENEEVKFKGIVDTIN